MTQDNQSHLHKKDHIVISDDIPLTDEIVMAYLEKNSDFFNRQHAFVNTLKLPDTTRGTVSLVERQLSQLRQKVDLLQEEITHLIAVANHNENLFILYSKIYLQLIDCTSLASLLNCLEDNISTSFNLTNVKLWLPSVSNSKHNTLINNDCSDIANNRFKHQEYYFGRLQEHEQQLIFSQPTSGSVVLICLTHNNNSLGFIAINSQNVEHFDPEMDTLLISQFKTLLAKLLYQHLSVNS